MIIAYVRVSTEVQSCSSQEYEIRQWAKNKGVTIDRWEKESASGTVGIAKRRLGKLLHKMRRGDMLVCTEISRFGRSLLMIMSFLNECTQRGIFIQTIKDNFNLDTSINSKIIAFAFALAAEIERNLISQRTKEALAERKCAGIVLGRPVGSWKNKEIIMRDRLRIQEMREQKITLSEIARQYGIHKNTLVKYLKTWETDNS